MEHICLKSDCGKKSYVLGFCTYAHFDFDTWVEKKDK